MTQEEMRKLSSEELRKLYDEHMDAYHRGGEGRSAHAIHHFGKALDAQIVLEDRGEDI